MDGAATLGATERFDVRRPLADATLTRRRLLEVAVLAAMAQLPLLADAPARGVTGANATANPYRRSTYEPLVGKRFAIRGEEGAAVRARLVEVRGLRGSAGRQTDSEGAFSLLFHGPRSPRLAQGMYELRYPGVGRERLLLVPTGTGRRGQDYEVVVNQYRAERG